MFNASIDGLHHHDHARPTTVGCVINGLVFACGVIPQVMHHDLGQTFGLSSAQDAVGGEAAQQFRNGGYNVNPRHEALGVGIQGLPRCGDSGRGPASPLAIGIPILGDRHAIF